MNTRPNGADAPATVEQLQQAIESLQAELIACQRLAALGSLAAMAAHEFNNLMTPIIARAEAALSMPDEAFMHKTVDRTLTQAQRAIALSQHLIAFADDDYDPVDSCRLSSAVHEAIETTARPFEKDGIDLRVEVPEELCVRAREDLLCQVLLNLLLNARQAMKGREGILAIRASSDGDYAVIDIEDSGVGISQEELDTRFNPFLRRHPREKPNDWQKVGLGLSVCRMIAHQHNARVEALRNPDAGCTFRLTWPLGDPNDV